MQNSDTQRLTRLKKKLSTKRPSFKRIESWRYKRVHGGWRAAKGIDSSTRQKLKNGVKSPNVGYRSPKKVRGLHPTGLKEVVVIKISDLEGLSPKEYVVKISSKIGSRKKMQLVEQIKAKKFKILNSGISYMDEMKMKELELLSETNAEEEKGKDKKKNKK